MLLGIITFALLVLLTICIVIRVRDKFDTAGGKALSIFGASILAFIAFWVAAGGISLGIYLFAEPSGTYRAETQELKAVTTKDATRGSMFLLTGVIDSERRVSFIARNSDGSFTPDSVTARNAKVFERADVKPTFAKVYHTHDTWWLTWWPQDHLDHYEFVVPKGSVAEDFTITP